MLIVMTEVCPEQHQFLEQHTGRWAAAEDRDMGEVSSSAGNIITFAPSLATSFIAVPITKLMPGNIFSLRAIPLCSLYRSLDVSREFPHASFSVIFMPVFNRQKIPKAD